MWSATSAAYRRIQVLGRHTLQGVRRRGASIVQQPSRSTSGMPSTFIDVNGVNIHYEQTGSGEHVVLLLPGGLGSTRTDFAPQLDQLSKDKFTLVAWDPPGYGLSRPPDRIWTDHFLQTDADLAALMMEKLGYSKYSLLGWSDGGTTAMILASHYQQNVRKLVSWGASSYVTKPEITGMETTVKNPDKWSPRMRQPFLELYGEQYLKQLCEEWVECFAVFYKRGGNICDEALPKIHCPTLIVHGDKDPMVPSFHCLHLHKHIQNSRLHRMPEGKHNLHLRYPEEFNSLVESFLLEPTQHNE